MTTQTFPVDTNHDHEQNGTAPQSDSQNAAVTAKRPSGQVLTNIQHGGHVVEKASPAAVGLAETREDITLLKDAVATRAAASTNGAAALVQDEEVTFKTPFGYLFPDLKTNPLAYLPTETPDAVVAGLKSLGDAMVENSLALGENPLQPTGNSTIPAIYTYWGQFIDHDLTANTDRDTGVSDITKANLQPIPPDEVVARLENLRQPTVNLDSIYGDGPTFDASHPTEAGKMYDGIKFRIGTVATKSIDPNRPKILGVAVPPDRMEGNPPNQVPVIMDLERDLPRIGALIAAGVMTDNDFSEEMQKKSDFRQRAFIADARNDENLIIAQLHLAFLRFHNAVVDWVRANENVHHKSEAQIFARAQHLVRWHHQWLVVNDFLKTITLPGVVDRVLHGGLKHYKPQGEPFMPLEFSVAAYRFGHTMVRAAYDYNRNFGRPGVVSPNASFNLLFTFTGGGFPQPFFGQTNELPFNWIIEWARFVDKGSPIPDHFARKIDTQLAPPLRAMLNQGNNPTHAPDIQAILKRLARRNLLRGYHLSIPTGQSIAEEMKITPLSKEELQMGNNGPLNQVLEDNGFLERTPLWYYVLKEAEVKANGNSLGELGSRIICETIIGQLRHDPESYLKQPNWNPSKGVKLPNNELIVTIQDLLKFAGLLD